MPYSSLEKRVARAAARGGMKLRKEGKTYQLLDSQGEVVSDSGKAPVRFAKQLLKQYPPA